MSGMSLSNLSMGMAGPTKGVGAAAYAPFPAPAGYRWEFVTDGGERLTDGEPLVDLMRIG